MTLADVNVLVYAFRPDMTGHADYREWLEHTVASDEPYGVSELVLSSFIRIVTNPRAFARPDPVAQALWFAESLLSQPNAARVAPGPRHWGIFERLCRAVEAKGNVIPDAYLAALAIEAGSEWITTDRGFARFPGLRWRHPLH
ncbi:MAG: type II toxin-antitoxin system VapC family toxin [Actinobacteria bacterium]|nr:type II toxin-antitoxin system VapC family toxin [Actinomycetota bacterium]